MAPFRPTLGVLGGGQLGRMLCEAAGPLGVPVIILDTLGSPAKQVNGHPEHITGSFKDPKKIEELARKSDVLTVEIEHVNADVLEDVATKGVEIEVNGKKQLKKVPVHPAPRTLKLIQDKFSQKEHLKRYGVPVAPQLGVTLGSTKEIESSLHEAGSTLGYPFMLKARKGSYDGRGNFVIKSKEDIPNAIQEMGSFPLYAEKWVPFVMELSVMVIRLENDDGDTMSTIAYPCVETVHEESICVRTYMPPRNVTLSIQEQARETARQVIQTIWGRGVFAVEMFLLEDNTLLVNEIAPRPHNSGHYTIEAVPQMSQYKAQLYAVLNLIHPSIRPSLTPRVTSAIMINILGGKDADSHIPLLTLADASVNDTDFDVYTHMYGKESKPSRKIGHITLTSHTYGINVLERKANEYIDLTDLIARERSDVSTTVLRPVESTPWLPASEPPVSAPLTKTQALVAVTMGSDTDLKILSAGLKILDDLNIPYEVSITSAHRTPDKMATFAREAAERGIRVIIAAAGGAAHLPGMIASHTPLPVIGIPVKATHLDGQDSLLSIVQMPKGVPCATVGIDNSTNAALLAVRILGLVYPEYQDAMKKYQLDLKAVVDEKAAKLLSIGYKAYLERM